MAKLLFVDDDTHTLALMEQIAQILGHRAYLCSAARDALQYAAAFCPDLILIDVNMQEISGFEVIRQIREFHGTAQMPALILSAGDPDIEGKKAMDVGANGFLPKPLTIKNLEDAIYEFTNHKVA
ncbi:MAG: hypothetical protein CVU39_04490 [Chloroflexi bacterium HGW-Chloroflexi-10]|nr:MAG: hypothetical protein CVU39_04490 [Chloroflexi bacterium HGW-Chloroflexi-10]